ncbi:piggyBac transposable element-derived protein 4-like [Schistocerca cancellata]|uniref:piggyBac transposable element-derived protein 4-like n=1 Tax=Schistocerca cancellata TaxID=274614 RepID=UPI0021193097|nr:piggyBac transposable element-derived protein 4-like [Schistocerca cancellata]
MESTHHKDAMQEITQKKWGGSEEVIQKPSMICDYTANMGGVDRADHYCAMYHFARKSLKWRRKIFFWLFEVGIINAYLLYVIIAEKKRRDTKESFAVSEESRQGAQLTGHPIKEEAMF